MSVTSDFTIVTGSRPESRSETGRRPASVLRGHPQPEDQQGHAHQLFVEVPDKTPGQAMLDRVGFFAKGNLPVGMCRLQPSVGSHVAVLVSDPEGYFADESPSVWLPSLEGRSYALGSAVHWRRG